MKIYVVFGETGEWSGRTEWMVAAYPNEEDAKSHVIAASAASAMVEAAMVTQGLDEPFPNSNPYDPVMEMYYYTGTRYYYKSVTLLDKFEA